MQILFVIRLFEVVKDGNMPKECSYLSNTLPRYVHIPDELYHDPIPSVFTSLHFK